jgi:uncharacterized protein DUF4255
MANDRVVWDLAVTLQELLRSRLSLPDGRSVNFAVDVPSGNLQQDVRPLVYVCLYEVEENAQFRKMDRALVSAVEEDGDLYEYYQFPPLAVQFRFLLTCFGRTREEEHRLLGQMLRIIHDHPILQGDMVKGDSVAPDEKVSLSIRSSFGIEAQSRFWLAAGEKFRPSVGCQLSVYVDSDRRERVLRVKERVVDVKRSVTGS